MSLLSTWWVCAGVQASQWALLVGAGEHNVPEWRLSAPRNDVALMQDLCLQWGVPQKSLITLTGRKATRAAVLNIFKSLSRKACGGDTVIFYFSGHGVQIADVFGPPKWRGDEARRSYADLDDEALVLADSVPGVPGSFLVDDEIGEAFEPFLAKKVNLWCILDCCFAYDGTKAFAPWAGAVKTLSGAPGFEDTAGSTEQAGGLASRSANVLDLGCNVLVAACGPGQAAREVWWFIKGHQVALSPMTFLLWEAAGQASSWESLSRTLKQAHFRLGLWWQPYVTVARASWLPCRFVDTSPVVLYDKTGGRIAASRAELLACIRRKSLSAQVFGSTTF